jgi:hypothetical protein
VSPLTSLSLSFLKPSLTQSLYSLVPISNTKQCIGIRGALKDKTYEGSQAVSFDNTVGHKDLYWYLRLAPDAVLNCVEGLKA